MGWLFADLPSKGRRGADGNTVTSLHPLTHHQILELVRPFTCAKRQLDLEYSDRAKRCLVFKPIAHTDAAPELAGMLETLCLENPEDGLYRLTRHVTLRSGVQASLTTEGARPADLLARLAFVPLRLHFRFYNEIQIAVSYLVAPVSVASSQDGQEMRVVATTGTAHVAGLDLIATAPTVAGYPAELELVPRPGNALDLPEDLLAVLGWDWGLLHRRAVGWRGTMHLRGTAADRTRQFEAGLETMVAHLAATLGRPPAQFHDALLWARWGVTGRRAIPFLIWLVLAAGAASLHYVTIPPGSIFRAMITAVPSLLLIIAFSMREIPSLTIPPLPRRLNEAAWVSE